MTYRVPCPSCQIVNVLKVTDLGKTLKCGACAGSFVFGDDILSDLKRKRREQEEREEREREAAEADRLGREAAAREAAAAIRREAEEKEEHERLMKAEPAQPTRQREQVHPEYIGLFVIGVMVRLCGVFTVLASFADVFNVLGGRHPEMGAAGPTVVFTLGVLTFAVGEALSALRDIARNSWRR